MIAVGIPLACVWRCGPWAVPGVPRSDFEYYFFPQRVFLSRWLSQGIFPFWNPHLFCGYPTIEIIQSSLFYPLNALVMALLPAAPGLLGFLSAHIVLAALLTWVALRHVLGLNSLPAMVGALVYLNGAVFPLRFLAGHPIIIYAMTWMPLGVAAMMRALRECAEGSKRDTVRWSVIASVVSAIVVLAGAPQYALYLLWAHIVVTAASYRAPWKQRIGLFVLVWVLAAALSSPQWLPTLFYLPYASRQSGSYTVQTNGASLTFAVLEGLFRYPFGDGVTMQHLNRRGIWDTASYCGILAVQLSIVAIACARRAGSASRLMLAQMAALLALSLWHTAGESLPGFSFFRESLRGLVLAQVALGILTALGMQGLMDAAQSSLFRRRFVFLSGALCAVAAGAMALSWACPALMLEFVIRVCELKGSTSLHPDLQRFLDRAAHEPALLLAPFRFALLSGALLCGGGVVCLLTASRSPLAGLALLAMLLVLDPLSANWRYYQTRVRAEDTGWPASARVRLEDLVRPELAGLKMPTRSIMPVSMTNSSQLIEGLCDPDGYDPAGPALAVARTVSFGKPTSHENAVALKEEAKGVRYEMMDTSGNVHESVPQQKRTYAISERWPRADLADLVTSYAETRQLDSGPIDGICNLVFMNADADRWRSALPPGLADPTTESLAVRMVPQSSPNRMVFMCSLDRRAILVVRSTWLPGWQCWVDGIAKGRPLLVNAWMTGVPLPSGQHRVSLEYEPCGLNLALGLSLAGILACACMLYMTGKRRRETPEIADAKRSI